MSLASTHHTVAEKVLAVGSSQHFHAIAHSVTRPDGFREGPGAQVHWRQKKKPLTFPSAPPWGLDSRVDIARGWTWKGFSLFYNTDLSGRWLRSRIPAPNLKFRPHLAEPARPACTALLTTLPLKKYPRRLRPSAPSFSSSLRSFFSLSVLNLVRGLSDPWHFLPRIRSHRVKWQFLYNGRRGGSPQGTRGYTEPTGWGSEPAVVNHTFWDAPLPSESASSGSKDILWWRELAVCVQFPSAVEAGITDIFSCKEVHHGFSWETFKKF